MISHVFVLSVSERNAVRHPSRDAQVPAWISKIASSFINLDRSEQDIKRGSSSVYPTESFIGLRHYVPVHNVPCTPVVELFVFERGLRFLTPFFQNGAMRFR